MTSHRTFKCTGQSYGWCVCVWGGGGYFARSPIICFVTFVYERHGSEIDSSFLTQYSEDFDLRRRCCNKVRSGKFNLTVPQSKNDIDIKVSTEVVGENV